MGKFRKKDLFEAALSLLMPPALLIALCLAEGSYAAYDSGLLFGLAILAIAGQILGAIWLYKTVRRLRLGHSIFAFALFASGPLWSVAAVSLMGAPVIGHGLSGPVWLVSTACCWIASVCVILAMFLRRADRRRS